MPQTTVAAIVTAPVGDPSTVLLTRRSIGPFKGQWCLPGGHIDPNEPAQVAIKREVKEETGLDFDGRFFNYFDEIIPDYDIHAVVIVFVGPGTGTPNAQPSEVADIKWFPLDEAETLQMAFQHNQILHNYAKRGTE